jgi:hypothetical protein
MALPSQTSNRPPTASYHKFIYDKLAPLRTVLLQQSFSSDVARRQQDSRSSGDGG